MRRKLVVVAALLAAGGGAAAWFAAFERFEARAVRICEEIARGRLVVPSSFERSQPPEVYRQRADLDAFMGWNLGSKRREDERMSEQFPAHARLMSIERDIFEAFETPEAITIFVTYSGRRPHIGLVNASSMCVMVVEQGQGATDDAMRRSMRVDGYRQSELALYGLP